MNILEVTNFFKPSWESGGPARVVYETSKRLVKRGHKVTVYTTDGFKYRLNVVKNKPIYVDGIKTYYFRNISNYMASNVFLSPYYALILAKKDLKNYDIIHIHEFSILGFIVQYYAKKYGIPYVLSPHGSIPFIMSKKRRRIGRIINKLIELPILYNASKIIALNSTEYEQIKFLGLKDEKICIVPNGVDISKYSNLPPKGSFKKLYGIEDDAKLILYMGRLNNSKGIDLIVKTFSKISNRISNVILIIAGPDDGNETCLKKSIIDLNINDLVVFTGLLDDKNKLKAYVDADVFVTPKFSGFPLTFLESCACGTPLVTTNKGDSLDWINNVVGYVTEYSEKGLERAIVDILGNEKLKSEFGENGINLTTKKFNWDHIIRIIENIYISNQ